MNAWNEARWLRLTFYLLMVVFGAFLGSRRASGQIGEGSIQVVKVQSQLGGAESVPSGAFGTSHRHGGPAMSIAVWTLESGTLGGAQAFFSGFEAFNLCGSSRRPDGKLVRCWIIPEQVKGNTGTFHVNDGAGASDDLFIYGTRSCVAICGSQAPEGCWCDSLCSAFGDCCFDKVNSCG